MKDDRLFRVLVLGGIALAAPTASVIGCSSEVSHPEGAHREGPQPVDPRLEETAVPSEQPSASVGEPALSASSSPPIAASASASASASPSGSASAKAIPSATGALVPPPVATPLRREGPPMPREGPPVPPRPIPRSTEGPPPGDDGDYLK